MDVLPLFADVRRKPVILVGSGEAAAAKRRLLERAGAIVVGEDTKAALAFVACDTEAATSTAAQRLKERGILVNAADRPELCDFTVPAIVDRSPVVVAVGTGGASAGLAAALRQRLETLLPASLGALAEALYGARDSLRRRLPDAAERRQAIGNGLAAGGPIDALGESAAKVADWAQSAISQPARIERLTLASADPDDLTLRQARLLAQADRLCHAADVPPRILDRARADAVRQPGPAPAEAVGLTVVIEMAA